MIGCTCPVCTSTDPRNRRRRSSLYVESENTNIVADTPPDFREQALAFQLRRVDAVLFTHSHADHIFGLDDIRRFNTLQQTVIPAYACRSALADLRRIFDYVEQPAVFPGTYRPEIEFREVNGPFDVGSLRVTPVEVIHGTETTLGFRFDANGRSLGYAPDCHAMSPAAISTFRGVDVMILDGLRHRPHATHLTVTDSVNLLREIGAQRSYITHMCHELDHETTQRTLPDSIWLSYDGLTLEW